MTSPPARPIHIGHHSKDTMAFADKVVLSFLPEPLHCNIVVCIMNVHMFIR